jgi:predicted transcriptional regulator|tara:strand:- start:326 stop:445 length:120 start_codon:yes stop_codon:yes gene_type:complete
MRSKKIQKAIERGDFIPHEEVMKRFSKRERDEIEQNPDI